MYRWSITEGLRRIDLDREDEPDGAADVGTLLRAIRGAEQRGVYLLLDVHPYLDVAGTRRQLRDLLQRRECLPHVIVLVGHRVELPDELEDLLFPVEQMALQLRVQMLLTDPVLPHDETGGYRIPWPPL